MTSGFDVPAVVSRAVSPGQRLTRVSIAVVGVSVVVHVGVPALAGPVGGRLFSGQFGWFDFLALSILVGLVAVGVVMAVLRVPLLDILALWPIGCVLAVVYWLLGIKALSMAGGDFWSGYFGTLAYVSVDTAGAVLGFVLAAVATEWRFALRLRLGLPLAAAGVTTAMCVIVYLIRYGK